MARPNLGFNYRIAIDTLMRQSYFLQRFFEPLVVAYFFPEPGLCPLQVVQECPCPGETSCVDLTISDVDMSGKNGIEFIEKLIEKGCKQRHFALMSGYFSDADLTRASKVGCVLFTKPLEMDAFAAWVEMVEKAIPSGRVLHDWVQIPSRSFFNDPTESNGQPLASVKAAYGRAP